MSAKDESMKSLRVLFVLPIAFGLTLACVLFLLVAGPAAQADNAPMFETPEGLEPGMPGITVQMAAETVDINVVERSGAVHALVTASFDMRNPGPSVNVLVGFPSFAGGDGDTPGGTPYFDGFDQSQIAGFRASSGTTTYQPVQQTAKGTGPLAGSYFVWQMIYPSNTTTNVQVSYDQTLDLRGGFAPLAYVLRTGGLWNGPIGDAVITMSENTGGTFLGADNATSVTPSEIIWHLTNVKPTFDPQTTYIVSDKWQAFNSAETRIEAGSASAGDDAAGTSAFLDITGRSDGSQAATGGHAYGVPFGPSDVLPKVLFTGYPDQARNWAWQATTLDPSNASAFEAAGDIEYFFALESFKSRTLICWPADGAAAYQQAVSLGSSTAQAKLDDLSAMLQRTLTDPNFGRPEVPDCLVPSAISTGGLVGTPPPVAAAGGELTDSTRAAILAAVDRANAAWTTAQQSVNPGDLSAGLTGQELSDDTSQINQLRGAGQSKKAVNTAFTVLDVSLVSDTEATVHTTETWSDEVDNARTGAFIRADPATTYAETYTVDLVGDQWIVSNIAVQ
jgi:hypothetical protein